MSFSFSFLPPLRPFYSSLQFIVKTGAFHLVPYEDVFAQDVWYPVHFVVWLFLLYETDHANGEIFWHDTYFSQRNGN